MIERGAKTADSTQDLRESWESVNAFVIGPNDSGFSAGKRAIRCLQTAIRSQMPPVLIGMEYYTILHVSDRNGVRPYSVRRLKSLLVSGRPVAAL